ncbi:MAG: hypothetical protein AAFP13_04080 [Pseudomonadota bacterium]
MVDIANWEEAEAFFETQSREVCCMMASRAALRVAANFVYEGGDNFETLVLTSFRAMLSSAGRGLGRPAEVEWLEATARSAAHSAGSAARSASFSGLANARSAASAARSAASAASATPAARSAARSADSAADSAAPTAAFSALSADSASPGFSSPLWPAELIPAAIERAHGTFLDRLGAKDGPWLWWRDWYLGMWNGTPTDWDFALKVAKIDDAIWEQGARAVADEIERLERRYRDELRKELADLRAALSKDAGNRLGIGGNNPPEAIDEQPREAREQLLIWEPLRALEAETRSNAPDKTRAQKAFDALIAGAKACGVYGLKQADIAVGASVRIGVAATAAWVAGYGPQIARVIEMAKTWIAGLL